MESEGYSSSDTVRLNGDGRRTITFQDLGIPQVVSVRPTIMGNIRTAQNLNTLDWILFFGGGLLVIVTFGLAVDYFVAIEPSSPSFVFGFLLVFNAAFASAYLFNGIFKEQAFEVLAFVLTTIVAIIYVTINFIHADSSTVRPVFKITALAIMFILGIPMSILGTIVGVKLWKSGNLIFRTVGADTRMQVMCRKLFTTITLIHFDVQILGSFLTLIVEHGFSSLNLLDILVVSLGLTYVFVWAVIAYFSLRKESKSLYVGCVAFSVVHYSLLLYFIIKGFINKDFTAVSYCRYSSGVLGLVVHTVLLVLLTLCYRNFNQGLKEKAFPSSIQDYAPRRN